MEVIPAGVPMSGGKGAHPVIPVAIQKHKNRADLLIVTGQTKRHTQVNQLRGAAQRPAMVAARQKMGKM